MFKRYALLLSLCLALLSIRPAALRAQILEDQKSYITKGFFISAEYGAYLLVLKPNTLSVATGPQADLLGSLAGFELGYDLGDRFSLQFLFWSANVRGDVQQGGGSGTYLFNLGLTFHFARVNRLYIFAKLGAGLMLVLPSGIFNTPGVMIHGGIGLRYYTRLRHFSFGIEALALFRPPTDPAGMSLGVAILPSIFYTF
jgi:hypothetical protein